MILAIDPSIMNLGWALLSPTASVGPRLIAYGTVVRKTGELSPESRINSIIWGLNSAIGETGHERDIDVVVIEQPQLWGSYKSAASLHQGALLGLFILTGALYWWANHNFPRAHLIPVTEWKGQLPKHVTQKRMEQKYGVKFATDDESDACGLGDYWLTERNNK